VYPDGELTLLASAGMNQWQQQPGPNWGPPPPGPPQQPYSQQPYPPQQSYPQQHYYPQPGYPQQYPGYPYAKPRPAGKGTAGTAIALGFITALLQLIAGAGYIRTSSDSSDGATSLREWIPDFMVANGVLRILAAAALVVRAVLLTRRNRAGRWVTVGAALTFVPLQILEYAVWSSVWPTSESVVQPLSVVIGVILPITIIVLVLTGSTRRWLAEGWLRR